MDQPATAIHPLISLRFFAALGQFAQRTLDFEHFQRLALHITGLARSLTMSESPPA
jgi:hypothetical protein